MRGVGICKFLVEFAQELRKQNPICCGPMVNAGVQRHRNGCLGELEPWPGRAGSGEWENWILRQSMPKMAKAVMAKAISSRNLLKLWKEPRNNIHADTLQLAATSPGGNVHSEWGGSLPTNASIRSEA